MLPVHLLGLLITLGVAVVAWRRRATTQFAVTLAAEMVALAAWTALVTLASVSTSRTVIECSWLAVPAVAAATATGVLILCLQLRTRTWAPGRRGAVLLAVEPLTVAALGASNRWHHLLLASLRFTGTPPLARAELGVAFWCHTGYCYLLMIAGACLLVRTWRHGPALYRRQLASMLVAQLVPLVGNAVTVSFLAAGRDVGDTPSLFVISALMMSYAVFRQGLLRIVPIARQLVLEQVGDAVLVIGPDGTVVDHNGALHRLVSRLPDPPTHVVGLDAQ
ncbi:MAG TPA: histidine kinase N-terminal 7TM domain-containing protein, partial [Kineosporiaceae bacterium]